jgi:quercetin dioxygenase-like cupin family protein
MMSFRGASYGTRRRWVLTSILVSCIAAASLTVRGSEPQPARTTTSPAILFTTPLQDVPGKHLVVVHLDFGPTKQHIPVDHRHPGSVYVYVTRGVVRLGIEGESAREVHVGESFFEPPGALHTVAESASPTESAEAIAVMIVPDGAPLTIKDGKKE